MVEPLAQRLVDVILAFPGALLAIVIVAVMGTGLENVMIAVGVVSIQTYTRPVRGQLLAVTPPIVVADGLDVQFFSSLEAAEGYLEATDVRAGVYKAYDSRGRALLLEAKGERVHMSAAPGESPQAQDLERLLRGYLKHIADDPGHTLPRLLQTCMKLVGLTS